MHKDDQMTPMERLGGFLTGGEMDRVLAMPFVMSMSGKAAGMTHREKRSSGRNEATAQIKSYERFGNDLLIVEHGLHTVGMDLGAVMADPEDAVPHILEWPLDKIENYDQLDWEKALPDNSKNFKLHFEAAQYCIDEVGSEVPTGMLMGMPFTAIASVLGTEKLLKACRRKPEYVHKMMRIITDIVKETQNRYMAIGCMCRLCEPIGTGSILPQKTFHEFIEPYMTEIIDNIKEKGGMCCYHICGDSSSIWSNMLASGPHMISVDNVVDFEAARNAIDPYMPIVGAVDTVDTMVLGTKEEIYAGVKECIRIGHTAAHGYVLASGCDLNVNVSMENVEHFMAAARKYGKLPFDEELLNS